MKKTTAYVSQSFDNDEASTPSLSNWQAAIQNEKPLTNYPEFSWQLVLENDDSPQFEERLTISRPLFPMAHSDRKICPYGDQPAPLAQIKKSAQPHIVRNAFALSSLRFEMNPFPDKDSRLDNIVQGIPTDLQPLYVQNTLVEGCQNRAKTWLELPSFSALEAAVDEQQEDMRSRYTHELAPLMNANPLDPALHHRDLPKAMVHDLAQYVQLQNSPYLFFDLMQWLERDVATRQWRSFKAGQPLSAEAAMILVMTSWLDSDGQRRKKPIECPVGVPLGYMQSVRRKNQPFITQEFAGHAHGALNHWLQEHLWQRFCARYPKKCQLLPSQFFKQLGHSHLAFVDSIYELHMANIANPANTNFWSVLQFYLPFMSPWP